MHKFERHDRIVKAIQKNGSVALPDLVDALGHSQVTIRRDLAELEREGKLVRTHGGAVLPQRLALEPAFTEKRNRNWEHKGRIAGRVLEDIPQGATVFIDAGTTCLEAGMRLLERGANPLFTNSVALLAAGCNYAASVVSIGGELRPISRALVGAAALNWVGKFHFDIALLGASAIHPDGSVLTTEIHEAALKSAVIARAQAAFLLADSAKLTDSATTTFATLDDFNAWYIDANAKKQKRPQLRKDTRANIIYA